jgi:PAS domain S-box-containing protein
MLTSYYTKSLVDYFKLSDRFYYILVNMEGCLVYVNPLFNQHFYLIANDFKGIPAMDIFFITDKEKYQQAVKYCLQNGHSTFQTTLKIKLPDGQLSSVNWEFSINNNEDGTPGYIQAIGIAVNELLTPVAAETATGTTNGSFQRKAIDRSRENVTEEKEMPVPLQNSELFYRNLFSNSLDGMLLTNTEGIIAFVSASVTTILGYDPEEVLGKNIFKYAHPEDSGLAYTAFMDEVAEDAKLKFISIRLLNKSGEWIWCIVRGHNLITNPYVKGVVVYFYDDTRRKITEEALIQSEKRFRNLIQNLNLGVMLQNEKTEVQLCNKAALDMLGLTEEQLRNSITSFDTHWNVIHEDGENFPGHTHPVNLAIQTKKPVRDIVMGVYRPVTKDRVWLLVNADPILDADNNITNIICSFTDISEQRRLSQELIKQEIQKQKLLTQATIDGQEKERLEIGKELHDNISQHLSTTRLYIEVAKEKATGEVLEMITHAHKNLTDIINEIRLLSQSLVPPTLGDLGLVESVQDLCGTLIRTHAFKIEFHHRYFNEDGLEDNMKLMLFRIIQEQVNNIIRHAQASHIIIRLQADAEQIILSVEDNGKGFDLHQNKKGLGLTNMMNRASLFNGKALIDTNPGKGCRLIVTIPLV